MASSLSNQVAAGINRHQLKQGKAAVLFNHGNVFAEGGQRIGELATRYAAAHDGDIPNRTKPCADFSRILTWVTAVINPGKSREKEGNIGLLPVAKMIRSASNSPCRW